MQRNIVFANPHSCGRGEMVDATDLKSVISNGVRVRVPPSAPVNN